MYDPVAGLALAVLLLQERATCAEQLHGQLVVRRLEELEELLAPVADADARAVLGARGRRHAERRTRDRRGRVDAVLLWERRRGGGGGGDGGGRLVAAGSDGGGGGR